jgi:hypothetical protein
MDTVHDSRDFLPVYSVLLGHTTEAQLIALGAVIDPHEAPSEDDMAQWYCFHDMRVQVAEGLVSALWVDVSHIPTPWYKLGLTPTLSFFSAFPILRQLGYIVRSVASTVSRHDPISNLYDFEDDQSIIGTKSLHRPTPLHVHLTFRLREVHGSTQESLTHTLRADRAQLLKTSRLHSIFVEM